MKSRFEPDLDPLAASETAKLIDPEAYDASEQQFAASLDEKTGRVESRFITNEPEEERLVAAADDSKAVETEARDVVAGAVDELEQPGNDPSAWRDELAAKVNHYRARRRPRAPRYPSLQLPFEPLQPLSNRPYEGTPGPRPSRLAVATQDETPISTTEVPQQIPTPPLVPPMPQDSGAKILEFPRSWAPPTIVVDELAEPVFDRPRILEAPEVLPPPPALGGMLIESSDEPASERRPGYELPLLAAAMSRRIAAGLIDALLVSAAFALFAYIFVRVTSLVPSWRLALGPSAALIVAFWVGYQYLLLVYSGTTPGLRLAKLQLNQFDGSAVPRNARRWRVLASVLSALSLSLGYAWCFLDEDALCWHDRITHTYMAPSTAPIKQVKQVVDRRD